MSLFLGNLQISTKTTISFVPADGKTHIKESIILDMKRIYLVVGSSPTRGDLIHSEFFNSENLRFTTRF